LPRFELTVALSFLRLDGLVYLRHQLTVQWRKTMRVSEITICHLGHLKNLLWT
jgi:hypothetical protein